MNIAWALSRSFMRRALTTVAVDDARSYRGIDLLVAAMHIADTVDTRSKAPRVGIMLPTSGVFGSALLGVLGAGRSAVPINYLMERETLEYVIKDSGCDLVISSRKLINHLGYTPSGATTICLEDLPLRSVPSPRWPSGTPSSEVAVVLYTSGTSGKPKGVMLTHDNLLSNVTQMGTHVGLTKSDVFLGVLPQFHSFGITALTLAPFLLGCKVVYSARFVPKQIISKIREHNATIYIGIPSMYAAILANKDATREDLSTLRLAISGGEPLHEDTYARFEERFGIRICEGFGMTETAPVTHVLLPEEHAAHQGSVGRPVPGVVQRIVDAETNSVLGPNTDGELRLAGPNIMRGYLNLPDQTAEAFDSDGLFRTGDMARIDDEGYLFITGRIKEMLIVGGENVFPREIEEVINTHPDVHASGVVGQRDPVRGEVPVAFVELEEHAEVGMDEIRAWCRDKLAGYKVPRKIEVLDALPRNPTGKVMRRELSDILARHEKA